MKHFLSFVLKSCFAVKTNFYHPTPNVFEMPGQVKDDLSVTGLLSNSIIFTSTPFIFCIFNVCLGKNLFSCDLFSVVSYRTLHREADYKSSYDNCVYIGIMPFDNSLI